MAALYGERHIRGARGDNAAGRPQDAGEQPQQRRLPDPFDPVTAVRAPRVMDRFRPWKTSAAG